MLRRKEGRETILFFVSEDADDQIEAAFKGECSILEVALEHNIDLSHSCEGSGTCGTCRVILLSPESDVESRNEIEAEMAADRCFAANERLACQLTAKRGLKVRIP